MEMSRSEYVLKNASVSLASQIAKNVLAFIGRTVFVYVLGAEYLGVNSLFTEILTVLSFAELGIGNAMVFSLYKPLAEKNAEKINSLMRLYARAYQIIGIVIAVLGIGVTPFLRYIVGDAPYVKENLTLLYLLFLLNSVLSYFFVYKKSLIIADQKNYVVDIYQQIFYALQVVLQAFFLILTKQFIPYLIITVICTFLNNVFVARKADKMYPYLRDRNVQRLDKSEVSTIIENIKALVVYKIGGIIVESTDSIFISSLINIITVGLYSNYKMVINVFRTVGNQIMNSLVASVGNLNACGSNEKKESVFNEMLYINSWFYGFTTVGLCSLLSPLVKIWLGESYVLGMDAVIAACIYYYVSNMHYPCYTYRTTAGLFVFGKYVPIVAAALNIILNLLMGHYWGLSGILWASTISRVVTYEIIDPVLVYKRVFQKGVSKYFLMYSLYAVLVFFSGLISYRIANLFMLDGFLGLIVQAIIITAVFNAIFLIITCRTKSFKSIYNRMKIIRKAQKRK